MNGALAACTGVEREFRERMMQLSGTLLLVENGEDEAEARELEEGVWSFIAGLHDVFGKDALIDDLIGLLLLTREARLEGDLAEVPAVMKAVVDDMAFQPHDENLRLSCSRRLRKAGVDMNRGF